MCSERARLRSLLLATLVVAAPGCTMNLVTGSPEIVDEVASLEATGAHCRGGSEEREVGPLADATRYRFTTFAGVLPEVLSPAGRVYYELLVDDPELVPQLERMVADLADVDPQKLASGQDRLAFWVNAYNAIVLATVAGRYAEDAAFRVDTEDFAFFRQEIHVVAGKTYSLNQIEHGVIRGDEFNPDVYFLDDDAKANLSAQHASIWGDAPLDARIHFVLNCASSSCPALPPVPLRKETLDATLDAATAAFLLDESKGAGPGGISMLFDFYYDDFFAEGGAEAFIGRFRSLDGIDFNGRLEYDWSLNFDPLPAE